MQEAKGLQHQLSEARDRLARDAQERAKNEATIAELEARLEDDRRNREQLLKKATWYSNSNPNPSPDWKATQHSHSVASKDIEASDIPPANEGQGEGWGEGWGEGYRT